MKYNLNIYKVLKLTQLLRNNKILFIVNGFNIKQNSWLKIEQNLYKKHFIINKLEKYSINSFLSKTIFQNGNLLFRGSLFLLNYNLTHILTKTLYLQPKHNNLSLIGILFKNKIYSKNQVFKIISFIFKKNLKFLYSFLKKLCYNLIYKVFFLKRK